MNGRNNKFLIPVAAVVLAVSLIGLAISAKQLFLTSNHQAAGSAGGNATSNAISSKPVNTVNPANANGQATRQAVARTNPANQRANSPPAYSIFHPPPVISYPIHGILNSKLSYPVHFVMAMAACPGGQTIAMATEGQGLVMFRPDARPPHRWVQFHPEKAGGGFPSWNTYSVCFDSQGRLWVGTLRKGVVVGFIGRSGWQWRHYDEICRPASAKDPNFPNEGTMTFNGPIGSHVFAITENPVDHSIWLSTEAGISVYYPRGARHQAAGFAGGSIAAHQAGSDTPGSSSPMLFGRWRYITQANGLPSSPVDCIAFDKTGRVFAGTQCNGIAIATMQDNYQHWRIVKGPDHVTIHGTGNGLPSDLINAILVTKRTSKVYVATDWGLGISDDDGQSWHYIRGQDYAAKVAQLWHPPKHWQQPSPQSLSHLLPGDHVTCLAQDFSGRIYLGTWRNGYAIYQSGKGIIYHNTLPKGAWRHGGDYVNAILPVHLDRQDSEGLGGPTKVVLVARYGPVYNAAGKPVGGKGNPTIAWEGGQNAAKRINERQPNTRFPEAAAPPTRDQLASMADQLAEALKHAPSKSPQIVPITDDWRTQGSWLGRYGRYWACLFACGSGYAPVDCVWRPGAHYLYHGEFVGPHRRAGDSRRFYVRRIFTGDSRDPELPEVYLKDFRYTAQQRTAEDRRDSSIDDHGEIYPITWQGPGIYVYLRIPPGAYTLSLYLLNCNGHTARDRDRDYMLSPIPLSTDYHSMPLARPNITRLADLRGSARDRVVNFWGGEWKRFLVRGPMTLTIRVARNYSLNTILQAAVLDPLSEHPAPYYSGSTAWKFREGRRADFRASLIDAVGDSKPPLGWTSARGATSSRGLVSSQRLLQLLDILEHRDPELWAREQWGIYTPILRYCVGLGATDSSCRLAAGIAGGDCCFRLAMFRKWESSERSCGKVASRVIEDSVLRTSNGGVMGDKALRSRVRKIDAHIALVHPFQFECGVAFYLIRESAKQMKGKDEGGLVPPSGH